MAWKTLDDMELGGKIVLTRVDINVPMDNGRVTDATRIERIVPTVKDILAKGGTPVLLAHFGRPKGNPCRRCRSATWCPRSMRRWGCPSPSSRQPDRAQLEAVPEGSVVLIENTRFTPMETENDPKMAQFLASLGDVFCNDAFSAAHRAHASTEGVAHLLPSCAGRLMQAELTALEKALGDPERPVLAVVGGAKVSTKLDLWSNLIEKVDMLVIGGGMANTFLAAQGIDVAASLCEHDLGDTAREILAKAETTGCESDPAHGRGRGEGIRRPCREQHRGRHGGPGEGTMILDAGPDSIARVIAAIDSAKTLIWNGPLGAFEIEPFDTATNAAAEHAAARSAAGALISVAGGGDTVAALNRAGAADRFTYISTAGGAFLEWMEGKTLPGVAALEQG
jgi:phosphoglycerate kinase